MAACSSTIEPKTPRRRRRRVRAEKKLSTAFSHEPEVGVKWKVQRERGARIGWLVLRGAGWRRRAAPPLILDAHRAVQAEPGPPPPHPAAAAQGRQLAGV